MQDKRRWLPTWQRVELAEKVVLEGWSYRRAAAWRQPEPVELLRGIRAATLGEAPLAPKAALALISERAWAPEAQTLTARPPARP
jgi:hypothetical protein